MDKQIIGLDLLKEMEMSLAKGKNWIAYNAIAYQLEKGDLYNMEMKLVSNEAIKPSKVRSKDLAGKIFDNRKNKEKEHIAHGSLLPKRRIKQQIGLRISK